MSKQLSFDDPNGVGFVTGGTFVFERASQSKPLWSLGENQTLWSSGEGLMIVGPQGVGKSSLAQQIALSRVRIGKKKSVLGSRIKRGKRVLYLAMDRPRQIARSFGRMVNEEMRADLDDRLVVWEGPLPFDPALDTKALLDFVRSARADTVIIDSLKDLAPKLTDDSVAVGTNSALQYLIANDIELIVLHHQRKASKSSGKPNQLDDVYGSIWFTAGMGSVVLLWGKAGQAEVELIHLKPIDEPVGPLALSHDHALGRTKRSRPFEELAMEVIRRAGDKGVTHKRLAKRVYGQDTSNEEKKLTRLLKPYAVDGIIRRQPGKKGGRGGGGTSARWFLAGTGE